MIEQQNIQHIPPVAYSRQLPPHEAAQNRLDYLEEVKLTFTKALQAAADESPWTISKTDIATALGGMKDIIDDMFYTVAEEDRDIVEANDMKEAREQSDHEDFERSFIRRF